MAAALAPAFATAAGVLAVAGIAKLRSPEPAAAALTRLGLPPSRLAVRIAACVEVAVGGACLIAPGTVSAIALAAAYLLFAGIVARLARAGDQPVPCGCFGSGSFTASPAHAVVNLVAGAVAAAAAFAPPPSLASTLADPLVGLVAVAAVGCAVWLAYLSFTLLPAALGAWSR